MAGKRDRQRRLAREHFERQQAKRARQAQRLRVTGYIAAGVAAVVALGVVGFFTLGGNSKTNAASATPTPSTSAPPTASPSPSPSESLAAEPARNCVYTPSGTAARKVGVPPAKPDFRATYTAKVVTNRGTIKIDLLNSKATCTVNSFVYLAGKSYFSNTMCHRLTTSGIYVLQCGDPTATGQGGPGYKFADENLTGATYTQGTIAMANSGPGTNGSQFFIVYKNSSLPPNYTPFGKVVSGLQIVQNVAKAGSDNSNATGDGHPKEKVLIERVSITKA